MVKKILRKTRKTRKINKKEKENNLGILAKDIEIFNTNKKIISMYIEMSFSSINNVTHELLETCMFAS